METVNNFINGEFVRPQNNRYIDVYEPATGKVYAQVADSSKLDVNTAISAALIAFPKWSSRSVSERASYLEKISIGLQNRLEHLARYESRDTGKPISIATKIDIPRAIKNFKFFSRYIKNFENVYNLNNESYSNTITRSPLGVVACISPWNLPLYLFSWKIAPALAAGNTVIAKPSEITPYTASKLAEVCIEVGFPKGVLNILNGFGHTVGEDIVKEKNIKAISFTGGTKTGAKIYKNSSSSMKKLSLEMGGKNPAVVFKDCDYEHMVETLVKSSFTNQGQICLCSSRIFVEMQIYERFKKDFIDAVSSITIGDPDNNDIQYGAISSKEQLEKICNYVELAKKEDGKILLGGNIIKISGRCQDGWFYEPTIIEGLDNNSRVNQEEIFGPVVTIQSFNSEKQAIENANGTDYGLSAMVWTGDKKKGNRIISQIDAGIIWLNCWMVRDLRTPFGGMKKSGLGREGGDEVLQFFTEQKNICAPI